MRKLFLFLKITVWLSSLTLPFSVFAAVPTSEHFADLVEQLMPAVVNISTTQKIAVLSQGKSPLPIPEGSPLEDFNDFFERFGGIPGPDEEDAEGRKAISLGSGFIIDPTGYIVTNNHVIAEAEEITVTLSNDTQFRAKIIGSDSKTDIALLKVDSKKPLPYVNLGDSNASRVGEWVIAIGNPFGLGGTVTAGIISARARDINAGPFDDFIQTDAAINKGNSGGPMFNTKGEVIGINTAIYSPFGGSIGIGFATPTSLAKPVIDQLRRGGRIQRGWLGVKIQSITEDIAESLGLKEGRGALVLDVTKDGPADKAGISTGDVILKFDGKEIATMRKLPRIVAETPIGKTVEMVILHNNQEKRIKVTVGELNEKEEKLSSDNAPTRSPLPNEETREILGLTLARLNASLRTKYNVAPTVKTGVAILRIAKNSEAQQRGLRAGDIILSSNQVPVSTPDEVLRIVTQAKTSGKKSVLFLIHRNGETQFIPLPLK